MKEKIAIIGTGISGLGAAYLLNKKYDITIYEKNNYIGGHTRTKYVNYDDQQIPVDTGFIVHNDRNYPNLNALFEILGVEIIPSDMSFGVTVKNGWLEYCGSNLNKLFGQRLNIFRPQFYLMLRDIIRFNKAAPQMLEKDSRETLGEFVSRLGLGDWFKRYYILPMGGAIWSCSTETMLSFPAVTFIKFFNNHGLLSLKNRPQWYTILGGSAEYTKKLIANFDGKIKLECAAKKVRRENGKIIVEDSNQQTEIFDHVIFASHADESLAMLEQPSERERKILSAFKYQENFAVLHNDKSFMPRHKKCWASWVYNSNGEEAEPQMSVTYWMNNLQSISDDYPLFVTLNPTRAPKGRVFDEHIFRHPVFNREAIFAQTLIPQIQGEANTWYVGAYQRYGFHEDGLASAVYVAKKLGAEIPWQNS